MDAQLTWRRTLDRLTTTEPLQPLHPLAGLSAGTLVLGIGSAGARVLELLADRIDDTNFRLTPPGQPPLNLLCIRFDDSGERGTGALTTAKPQSENVPITTLTITETHVATDGQKHPDHERRAEWLWLEANPAAYPNASGLDRRAARVMLFNHLQVGRAAPLIDALTVKLKDVRRVYIIASAIEYAGSSVIGDLTALLRLQAPMDGISINACVLFEDKHPDCHDLDNASFYQDRFRVATLHELSRLAQDGRVSYRYSDTFDDGSGDGERLIYAGSAMHMLDGAAVIYGQSTLGCQRLSAILWGAITAQDYSTKLNEAVGGVGQAGLRPAVSVIYSHALYWPLRLLRKRYAALLVKFAIGDGQPPSSWRPPQKMNDPAQIDLWLDGHHEGGLIDITEFLSRSDPRYGTTRRTLQEIRAEAEKAITDTNGALGRLTNSAETERFVPPQVKGWAQLVLTREKLQKIREYIGWEATDLRDPANLLRLRVGLPRDGQTVQVIVQPQRFREALWETATRLAERFLHTIIQEPLALQMDDVAAAVKRSWHGRYAVWIRDINLLGGQNIRTKALELSRQTFNSWTPADEVAPRTEAITGSDPTFILQTTVIERMPVAQWNLIKNTNIQLSVSDLVDAPEVLTFRMIVERYKITMEKVPLFWRNLLPHSEALVAFLACAAGNGLSEIAPLVNINFPETKTPESLESAVSYWAGEVDNWIRKDTPENWQYALDSFVTSYETDDGTLRERLQVYINQLPDANDSSQLLLPV